jgi:hypothetical protein
MPLYVVRWPNLSAALVRAEDQRELLDILDEIGNPDGCSWAEYDGPLFLDFQLAANVQIEAADSDPARPLDPEQLRIEGVDEIACRAQELVTITPCEETGDAMVETICRFAFPATAAIYWGDEYEIDRSKLERALQEDAMRLVEYTWRRSHLYRSSDPDARLAIAMDASPEWLKNQRAAESEDDGEDDPSQRESSFPDDIAEILDMARGIWLANQDALTVRKILLDTIQLLEEVSADEPST